MGAASSREDGERPAPLAGFRVLGVQPNSPASDIIVFPSSAGARDGLRAPLHASLVSYLDCIVSVNGETLEADSDWFADEIRENVGQPVILEVFNYKCGKYRTVQVVPRGDWGGDGFLGLHVRWDSLESAAESVLHVVDTAPGLPAAAAGLQPSDDYILGSADGSFESVDIFGDYIAVSAGSDVTLYVLRASTDSVREVRVHCAEEGVGVTLAYGHLHQLPNRFSSGRNEFELTQLSNRSGSVAAGDVSGLSEGSHAFTPREGAGASAAANPGPKQQQRAAGQYFYPTGSGGSSARGVPSSAPASGSRSTSPVNPPPVGAAGAGSSSSMVTQDHGAGVGHFAPHPGAVQSHYSKGDTHSQQPPVFTIAGPASDVRVHGHAPLTASSAPPTGAGAPAASNAGGLPSAAASSFAPPMLSAALQGYSAVADVRKGTAHAFPSVAGGGDMSHATQSPEESPIVGAPAAAASAHAAPGTAAASTPPMGSPPTSSRQGGPPLHLAVSAAPGSASSSSAPPSAGAPPVGPYAHPAHPAFRSPGAGSRGGAHGHTHYYPAYPPAMPMGAAPAAPPAPQVGASQ